MSIWLLRNGSSILFLHSSVFSLSLSLAAYDYARFIAMLERRCQSSIICKYTPIEIFDRLVHAIEYRMNCILCCSLTSESPKRLRCLVAVSFFNNSEIRKWWQPTRSSQSAGNDVIAALYFSSEKQRKKKRKRKISCPNNDYYQNCPQFDNELETCGVSDQLVGMCTSFFWLESRERSMSFQSASLSLSRSSLSSNIDSRIE